MFKKLFYKEDGFTLVELLVTIAILAVLFGITTLALSGVGDDAQESVCKAETHVVQSAIDIFMAANPTNTITASGATAIVITAQNGEFSDYLRSNTKGKYTWDASGENLLQAAGCW